MFENPANNKADYFKQVESFNLKREGVRQILSFCSL